MCSDTFRLNRTTSGKEDTFVLDFVNKPEDVQKSFGFLPNINSIWWKWP